MVWDFQSAQGQQSEPRPPEPVLTLGLNPGKALDELFLWAFCNAGRPFVLYPRLLKFEMQPHGGKPVKAPARFAFEVPQEVYSQAKRFGRYETTPLPIRLDCSRLKSGMYYLSVKPLPGAVQMEDRQVKPSSSGLSLYLPAPLSPPRLEPGQRFFCLPDSHRMAFPYRDAKGEPAEWQKVALRDWRLERVEPPRLWFRIEGQHEPLWTEWEGPVERLPSLTPLVEESSVRALRARYEGRLVWGYGGTGAIVVLRDRRMDWSVGFERLKPVRLLRIRRLWKPWVSLALGSSPGYIGEPMSAFYTHHPLLVLLQPQGKPTSGMMGGPGLLGESTEKFWEEASRLILGYYHLLADAWDFERKYSHQHPFKANPRWTARERKAVQEGELRKGLTHEMVAWIMGWPGLYGTKEELKRLNEWVYDSVPPFSTTLTFRNGRLVGWDIPRLP